MQFYVSNGLKHNDIAILILPRCTRPVRRHGPESQINFFGLGNPVMNLLFRRVVIAQVSSLVSGLVGLVG